MPLGVVEERAAAGRRSPLRGLIVGETDHVQFNLPPPDQLDDTCAALPPDPRGDIKRASLDDLVGMIGALLDGDEHAPLSPERQARTCALGALCASRCETPKLAATQHSHAAVGVFRLKHGGCGCRWAGAVSAADDGEALASSRSLRRPSTAPSGPPSRGTMTRPRRCSRCSAPARPGERRRRGLAASPRRELTVLLKPKNPYLDLSHSGLASPGRRRTPPLE